MKYLLGIDQGTTQTTAVVVNELGEILEKNSAQLPARFPQAGWVEQDPLDVDVDLFTREEIACILTACIYFYPARGIRYKFRHGTAKVTNACR